MTKNPGRIVSEELTSNAESSISDTTRNAAASHERNLPPGCRRSASDRTLRSPPKIGHLAGHAPPHKVRDLVRAKTEYVAGDHQMAPRPDRLAPQRCESPSLAIPFR